MTAPDADLPQPPRSQADNRPPRAAGILLRDDVPHPLTRIAGIVCRPAITGRWRCAMAVVDAERFGLLHASCPEIAPATGCGDAGAEATGEQASLAAAIAAALRALPEPAQLLLLEGHGTAAPDRFGLACAVGLATGIASVGVAGEAATGGARMTLHEMRGAHVPWRDGPTQVGWLLRTRVDAPPLIVSPGHRVAMASSARLVLDACRPDGRWPEPLRFALEAWDRCDH